MNAAAFSADPTENDPTASAAPDVAAVPDAPGTPRAAPPRRLRRALLWALLLVLLAVAQTLLVFLTLRYEDGRVHEAAEGAAAEAVMLIRRDLLRLTHAVQTVTSVEPDGAGWRPAVTELLRRHPELRRIEWRSGRLAVAAAADTPLAPPLFARMSRAELSGEVEGACRDARREAAPAFSRSYFVPLISGTGLEVVDLCVPVPSGGREAGFVVGTVALPDLLEAAAAASRELQQHELTFVESDGARLARAGARRGAGVHVAEQALDLPGQPLRLRADSLVGHPSLIPNLTLALVLGLSIALFGLVFLLARDVRRRAEAEQALAESLGFRKAMEDSLSTGLRARDLQGAITYVNPAFCAMVGYSAEELRAVRPPQPPPYWPPERVAEYAARQRDRMAAVAGVAGAAVPTAATAAADAAVVTGAAGDSPLRAKSEPREGLETLFVRRSGERFPAMVYEAPLLDGAGRQTGWMGSVLDMTAARRFEELARQQQERLQASARLATVGEMASLLSHELNQPLAAIASYSIGSLNLLEDAAADGTVPQLQLALGRIAEQAERAGRVIKSVHDFVRRREQLRETIAVDLLLEAVLPLVRLQARKSAAQIELQLPQLPARMPRVVCDRTMVEQVLLNLTRNGIQAMETATPVAERRLVIAVAMAAAAAAGTQARVAFEITDAGPGIAPEVAERLFTPFFTTRAEGMGLGLSLCRTVIEQHEGTLTFVPGPGGRGITFRFTLAGPRGGETA